MADVVNSSSDCVPDVSLLEKRISSLENIARKIEAAGSGDDADYKKLKESVQELLSVREKLREMEDLDLITKLETIQTQDEIIIMQDDFNKLKKKVDLISDAVKIINAKIDDKIKSGKTGSPVAASIAPVSADVERIIKMMQSDIDALKQRIDERRMTGGSSVSPAATESVKAVKELEEKYEALEVKTRAFMDNTKSLIELNDMKRSKDASASGVGMEKVELLEHEAATLKNLVAGIDKSLSDSRVDISNLKVHMDRLEACKADADVKPSKISDVSVLENPELRDELQEFSSRISLVEDRIQSLLIEWDKLDKDVSNVSSSVSKVDGMSKEVDGISKDVAEFGRQVDGIKSSLNDAIKALESRINDIHGNVAAFKDDMAVKIDSEIGAIKKSDARMAESLKSSEARMAKQDKMFKEMDKMFKAEISKIKKTLASGMMLKNDPKMVDLASRVSALELEQKSLMKAYNSTANMSAVMEKKAGVEIKDAHGFKVQLAEMLTRARDFDIQLKDYRRKFSADIFKLKTDFEIIDSKIAVLEERLDSGISELEAGIAGMQNTSDMLNDSVKKIADDLKADNDVLAKEINAIKAASKNISKHSSVADASPAVLHAKEHADVATVPVASAVVPAVAFKEGDVGAIQKRISDVESKVNDFEVLKAKLLEYLKKQVSIDAENKIKYVPVIKENVAKLYHSYRDIEKRVSLTEDKMSGMDTNLEGKLNDRIKVSIDTVINENVKRLDTLSKSMDVRLAGVESSTDHMKRVHSSEMLMLKAEMAKVLEARKKVEEMDLDEISEFRDRVLGELDEIKVNLSSIDSWKKSYIDAQKKVESLDLDELSEFRDRVLGELDEIKVNLTFMQAWKKSNMDALEKSRKAQESEIVSIKSDISKVLANMSSKKKTGELDYQEISAFRDTVLSDIDELRLNINALATKNKTDDIEGLVNTKVKALVEHELADVVANIDTLSKDLKKSSDDDNVAHKAITDEIKKGYQRELLNLRSEVANIMNGKKQSSDMNYEEFAEFRAKVMNDIDDLKIDVKSIGKAVSSGDVENMIDGRLVKYAEHIDNIAGMVKLLERKVEQRHLEVSQNSHKKITDSYRPLDERLSAIEGDVMLLKDMRGDLIDDVNEVIDHMKSTVKSPEAELLKKHDGIIKSYEEKVRLLEEKIGVLEAERASQKSVAEMVYALQNKNNVLKTELEDNLSPKISDFEKKIQSLEAGLSYRDVLEQRIVAMQRESDILRNELENMKALYFQMLKKEEEEAPMIIE